MTTDMNELERIVSELASYFAREPGVHAAWLFGSYAQGRSHREDVLPWSVLVRGFDFKGARVPLVRW